MSYYSSDRKSQSKDRADRKTRAWSCLSRLQNRTVSGNIAQHHNRYFPDGTRRGLGYSFMWAVRL